MDKCPDLLPDYYSFVKGLVDSEDIALNISRETMQQNHQVSLIAKNIENKIHKELLNMLNEDRENYEKFYQAFGMQLKHGIYSSYGMNKDKLEDLLLFYSSKDDLSGKIASKASIILFFFKHFHLAKPGFPKSHSESHGH